MPTVEPARWKSPRNLTESTAIAKTSRDVPYSPVDPAITAHVPQLPDVSVASEARLSPASPFGSRREHMRVGQAPVRPRRPQLGLRPVPIQSALRDRAPLGPQLEPNLGARPVPGGAIVLVAKRCPVDPIWTLH